MRLSDPAGGTLPGLARAAVAARFGGPACSIPDEDWLTEPGASFVTITKLGQLRGCIGTLIPYRPLGRDVVENARHAAFDDHRFAPLSASELKQVRFEVSVLSEPETLRFRDREDALSRLRPGVDGLILTAGGHRATFLPQVWEQLPTADQFVAALLRKAGLDERNWPDRVSLATYTVQSWEEDAPTGDP